VITLAVVVTAGKKMQNTMNKRLKLTIDKFNKINYKKDNSKRIIIGTLKPNCDNSQKRSK
tara:strand:+ start:166 stop:345 length:180 start_codon:yes stop_codon:yes gene_type:complete